jgi:hypothetical protein
VTTAKGQGTAKGTLTSLKRRLHDLVLRKISQSESVLSSNLTAEESPSRPDYENESMKRKVLSNKFGSDERQLPALVLVRTVKVNVFKDLIALN